MPRLYSFARSGNAYKARLALAQLGVEHDVVEVDIRAPDGRPEWFLKKHPSGKVPLLELDDGRCLSESGAILYWAGNGTPLLPADDLDRAEVLSWMFFEQNRLMPNLGPARLWTTVLKNPDKVKNLIPLWQRNGNEALRVMDVHLERREFFAAARYTLADLALFGYTHLATEGGFDLDPFPRVNAWLERVREQPGFVPL